MYFWFLVSFKPFGLGKIKFQFLTVIVATANNEIVKSNIYNTFNFFLSLLFSDKAYIVFPVVFPL